MKKNELYSFVDKNFSYLVAACIVVVVFLFTYFLIVPTWKEIRDVSVLELEQKQDRLTEMQKFLSELKTMRDKYTQIDYNDIQRLETVLPKGFNKQKLFLQLEELVTQKGLTVSSIAFIEHLAAASSSTSRRNSQTVTDSSASTGGVEQVDISLTVQGVSTYDSFKEFLTSIESFGPMLTLASVDYPVSSTALSITLTTYYLSES